MATINALVPVWARPGQRALLASAVGVFPVDTLVYICDYFYQGTTLNVRVRAPDTAFDHSSVDLVGAVSIIKQIPATTP